MQLSLLSSVPQFLHEIATSHFAEWHLLLEAQYGIFSVGDYEYLLKAEFMSEHEQMPLMIVAHLDGRDLVGTVSLQQQDLPVLRPDLVNWMASLYIVPEARKLGFGSFMIRRALAKARELKLPKLHVWTRDKHLVPWYESFGFQVLDDAQFFFHDTITIMHHLLL